MKLNIRKLQTGGVFSFKALPVMAQPSSAPSASSAGSSASSDDGDTDELLKAAVGKGITSDVYVYAKELQDAYKKYATLPASMRGTPIEAQLKMAMKGDWARLTQLERSAKALDQVRTEQKDAMNEFVVDSGTVVVKNLETGKVEQMTIPQYQKQYDAGKVMAMTVSALINERENNPEFANNNQILSILPRVSSVPKIRERALSVLGSIGKYAQGTSEVSYEDEQAAKGAQAIKSGQVIKTLEATGESSNLDQIRAASNSLWATMNSNDKDALRVMAIHYGKKPEEVEGAAAGLLLSMLSHKADVSRTLKSGETPSGRGTTSRTGGKAEPINPVQAGLSGAFGSRTMDITKGNGNMQIHGFTMMGPMDDAGKPLGNVIAGTVNSLAEIGDMTNATFNMTPLSSAELAQTVIKAGPGVRAIMPITEALDEDGKPIPGKFVPNMDLADKYMQAQKEIAARGDAITVAEKKVIWNKRNIPVDERTGNPTNVRTQEFIVYNASTYSDLFDTPPEFARVSEEDKDKAWFQNFFRGQGVKRPLIFPEMEDSDILHGSLFIPVQQSSILTGAYATGDKMTYGHGFGDIATWQTNTGAGIGASTTGERALGQATTEDALN